MFDIFAHKFVLIDSQIFCISVVNEADSIVFVTEYYAAGYAVENSLRNFIKFNILFLIVCHVRPFSRRITRSMLLI
jgi:hypothetical protein